MDAEKLARRLDAEFPGTLTITVRSPKRLYVAFASEKLPKLVIGKRHRLVDHTDFLLDGPFTRTLMGWI